MKYMEIKKVNPIQKDYRKIKKLLDSSFPENERIPMWRLYLLSLSKGVNFRAFYENNIFFGFTYTIETDEVVFLLYLAINKEIRSKGYGSTILRWLKANSHGKEIILNVEIPDKTAQNNEQRIRRIAFYESNGFTVANRRLSVYGEEYYLLTTNEILNSEGFRNIAEKSHFRFVLIE